MTLCIGHVFFVCTENGTYFKWNLFIPAGERVCARTHAHMCVCERERVGGCVGGCACVCFCELRAGFCGHLGDGI